MKDKEKQSIWHKVKTFFLGVKYEVITKDEAGNIISIEEESEQDSLKSRIKYSLLIGFTWINGVLLVYLRFAVGHCQIWIYLLPHNPMGHGPSSKRRTLCEYVERPSKRHS